MTIEVRCETNKKADKSVYYIRKQLADNPDFIANKIIVVDPDRYGTFQIWIGPNCDTDPHVIINA